MPETSIWATGQFSHALAAGVFVQISSPKGPLSRDTWTKTPAMGSDQPAAVRNFFSSGPEVVAPSPPSSTNTATARSPCTAMIQAWVFGGLSLPNSAVPVLAPTGSPGTSARKPAWPDVTTARIMSASDAASALVTGFWASFAGASAVTVDDGAEPSAVGAGLDDGVAAALSCCTRT